MQKKWFLKRKNQQYVDYIAKATNIHPVLVKVLLNRDINTPQKISAFYNDGLEVLCAPYEIDGMEMAVVRTLKAIQQKENVLVCGDYDADGVTATSIMVTTLLSIGACVSYFIPNRFEDGYGFHMSALKIAKKLNVTLIITVDCGITAFETIENAKKLNIDVIVTDHHEPRFDENNNVILPKAFAIINPKIDCKQTKPYSSLTGAGLALKMSMGLFEGSFDHLVEMAAIGTIADVAPLTDENRTIVKKGMEALTKSKNLGIRTLLQQASLKANKLTPSALSFSIIPRINAAGRLHSAEAAVKLFLTDSDTEASLLATQLDKLNTERQKLEETVLKQAIAKIEHNSFENVILVWDDKWHEGVLGIVASRLVEKYNRPAFVFTVKNNTLKGSARSVNPLDLCHSISTCDKWLIKYGGHKQAAGLQLQLENIPHFEEEMNAYINQNFSKEDFTPSIMIDADVSLKDLSFQLVKEMEKLSPFGTGNPEPLLASKNLQINKAKIVGKNHLKCQLASNGCSIEAIAWDCGNLLSEINIDNKVDAVFSPSINDWNGNKHVQLCIRDIRLCR
ncbi:MAG: single-stranded-DNA-specific exonuclease RecJ [Candidatus Magnetoovum sp. WYHC-5]|nr:single-stranded-DNA-specific exonuclease RecJ [Candidatus Magnetoovum sp. WYHC-5]